MVILGKSPGVLASGDSSGSGICDKAGEDPPTLTADAATAADNAAAIRPAAKRPATFGRRAAQ
ncbi:MAG: hypothetical protein J2P53_05865 [Bradyrhizobiaceae bacterium]|nr:hypothetical protein [Bradyrhizobiaceae bacterium]